MPRIERYVYKPWDKDDKGDNEDEARTYSQMGMLLGEYYELSEDSDSDGEDGYITKDANASNYKYMTVGANVAPNMEPINNILAPAIKQYQSSASPHKPFYDIQDGNWRTPFGGISNKSQTFASEDLKGLMNYFLGTSFSKEDNQLLAPGDGYALLKGSIDFKGEPYTDTRFKTTQDVLDMLSFVANENNALGNPSKPLNTFGWARQIKAYFKSLDELCDEEHNKMKEEDPVYKKIWNNANKTAKSKAYDKGDITPPKIEPTDDIRKDDQGYYFASGDWHPQDPNDRNEIIKLSQTYINKLPIMKKLGYPQEHTDYEELEREDRIEIQKHFLNTIPAIKCTRENMEDEEDEKPGTAFLKALPATQLIHECDLNRESMSGRRENITGLVEDLIESVFESIIDVLMGILTDLIGAIGYGINAIIKSIISVVVNGIATIANSINVAVTTAFGAIDDAIINAGIFIHDTLITIRTTVSNVVIEAGGLIDEAVDSTADVAVSIINAVSDPAVKLFDETGGAMVNAIDSSGDVANNIIDTTQDAANNVIDETGNTIISGTTAVGDSFEKVFDTIPQAVEDSNFIPFIGETALAFKDTLKEWIPFMDPMVGKREPFLGNKKYYLKDYKQLPPIPEEEPTIDSSTTLVHRMGIIIFILLISLVYFATRPLNNNRRSTRYETYA